MTIRNQKNPLGAIGISPSGAVYVSEFENELIRQGLIFGISKRFTIAGGGTLSLVFNPTAYTGRAILILPPLIKAFGAGPIYADLYIDPVYTGGTIIESINFNFNSTNTAAMTITANPTITDIGTKSPNEYAVFSSSAGLGAFSTQTGGEASAGNLVYDIDLDEEYLFQMVNQEPDNTAELTFVTDWVEF